MLETVVPFVLRGTPGRVRVRLRPNPDPGTGWTRPRAAQVASTGPARMDRLGRLAIFRRIALPLGRPALAAVAISTFLTSWNPYLEPIVYLSSKSMYTLPQALTQFTDPYQGQLWNVQLSAASMTAIPVLIVFVIAQRQFIEGLAHTGLKG